MSSLVYARQRVQAFLAEIEVLKGAEFPYPDSEIALLILQRLFKAKLDRLDSLSQASTPSVIGQECSLALRDLIAYLPILGFILRSTNVRNAFELFGPFRRLAAGVLEPEKEPSARRSTNLLLSSEWDYIPFTYPDLSYLPNFVLIGLPAPESSNPLLFPLAGHELGHTAWVSRKMTKTLKGEITTQVLQNVRTKWTQAKETFEVLQPLQPEDLPDNLLALDVWMPCVESCTRQIQETFCDFVGLRIFGASYLHAFGYLLSPNDGKRSANYPAARDRREHLRLAAEAYGVPYPAGYESLFEPQPSLSLPLGDQFQLEIADASLRGLVPQIIDHAKTVVGDLAPSSSPEKVADILREFRRVIPSAKCASIADIINAGWLAFQDEELWQGMPEVRKDRDRVLKELILKTLEIYEIEQLLGETP